MRASTPGNTRAETAAPPGWPADTSPRTPRPEPASRVAATRPLWPAPTTMTSGLLVDTPPSLPPSALRRVHGLVEEVVADPLRVVVGVGRDDRVEVRRIARRATAVVLGHQRIRVHRPRQRVAGDR